MVWVWSEDEIANFIFLWWKHRMGKSVPFRVQMEDQTRQPISQVVIFNNPCPRLPSKLIQFRKNFDTMFIFKENQLKIETRFLEDVLTMRQLIKKKCPIYCVFQVQSGSKSKDQSSKIRSQGPEAKDQRSFTN